MKELKLTKADSCAAHSVRSGSIIRFISSLHSCISPVWGLACCAKGI